MNSRLLLGTLMLGVGLGGVVEADQLFTTPSGATAGSPAQSVSASADFDLSGTTLTIALTDTQPNIKDAGQLLTDVFFTLSTGASPSLSSETGNLVKVAKTTNSVTDLGVTTIGWGFGGATVGTLSGFELCVICQGGPTATATPSEGIIGPASVDGKYDDANGSIAGNKAHNPFVSETANFTITGIPTGTMINGVIFSFGTTAGAENVTGSPTSPIPEPASVLLLGTVLLGLSKLAPKLRRQRS